jgi:hypothetical protein
MGVEIRILQYIGGMIESHSGPEQPGERAGVPAAEITRTMRLMCLHHLHVSHRICMIEFAVQEKAALATALAAATIRTADA